MAKQNSNRIRIEIASQLQQMGTLLNDLGILLDDSKSSFESAAEQCRSNCFFIPGNNPTLDSWGYSLEKVLLRVTKDKLRHVEPAEATDITIEYSVQVTGNTQVYEKLSDPCKSLSFNIIINAKNVMNEDMLYRSCWHLDRNIQGQESPDDAHPHYHFHFGGNNMKFQNTIRNYGSTLFLDSPRLAHKPLDGVLATDFILSNFASNTWKLLTDPKTGNSQYQAIVKNAQQKIWKPYAVSTAHFFAPIDFNESNWQSRQVWPQLI